MSPIRQTVFKNGEALPESKPNTWRLYSMRFCPFAQKTRLALAHKNVNYETVNIHLKDKPDWFLQKNPLGAVPVLEKNDTIIYESGICNDYLEEMFPGRPLYPKDPYEKARLRILMERFSKVNGSFFAALSAAEDKKQEAIKNVETNLRPFEDALQGKFFGGDDLSMLDIHTWPWFERMEVRKLSDQDILVNLPKLKTWRNNMKNHPTVQATLLPEDIHQKFAIGHMAKKPNYDIGL